jgi:hypothetical protein
MPMSTEITDGFRGVPAAGKSEYEHGAKRGEREGTRTGAFCRSAETAQPLIPLWSRTQRTDSPSEPGSRAAGITMLRAQERMWGISKGGRADFRGFPAFSSRRFAVDVRAIGTWPERVPACEQARGGAVYHQEPVIHLVINKKAMLATIPKMKLTIRSIHFSLFVLLWLFAAVSSSIRARMAFAYGISSSRKLATCFSCSRV